MSRVSQAHLWRRHTDDCPDRKRGRGWARCKCPIWFEGTVQGKRVRKSMRTGDWDKATRKAERVFDPDALDAEEVLGIPAAVEAYIQDCIARKLAPSTIVSYRRTLDHFAKYCAAQAYTSLKEVNLRMLGDFRARRTGRDGVSPVTASTQRKEIECLRAFCSYCVDQQWLDVNLAKKLKPAKEPGVSTLPFSDVEVERILAACEQIKNNNGESEAFGRRRARALVLLLLYSGLRISDAAKLEKSALDRSTGRLLLRIMKTKSPLYVKVAPDAIEALDAVAFEGEYFFWSGKSRLETVKGSLRRTLTAVAKFTKTDELPRINVHPHRFRDTFAVRLLEEDVPIRTVQLLLGHKSVLTTERHYAHFLSSQQRLLDAAVDKLDFSSARKPPQYTVENRLGNAKRNVRARVLK